MQENYFGLVERLFERTTFARIDGLYDVFSGAFTPIRPVSLTVTLTNVSFFSCDAGTRHLS